MFCSRKWTLLRSFSDTIISAWSLFRCFCNNVRRRNIPRRLKKKKKERKERMEIELWKYFKENFVLVLFYFFILVVFAFFSIY